MKKKVIFIASSKGGSGKTTLARALLEFLRKQKKEDGSPLNVYAYDTDPNVGQFAATYGLKNEQSAYDRKSNVLHPEKGVLMFDAKFDQESFTDTMDVEADIILMDLPGGLIDVSHVFGDMESFKAQYKREGYEVVVINVITQVQASASSVNMVMDIWGDGVTYIVAKNKNFGSDEDFYFFDGELAASIGNPAKRVKDAGGKVIEFPSLDHGTFGLIDKWSVTFEQAIPMLLEQRGVLTGWRLRLTKLENFLSQTNKAFEGLGLQK